MNFLYEDVILFLEKEYMLQKHEVAKLESFTISVEQPSHRTLNIYTKQSEYLCGWEENWLDKSTKVYYKKGQRNIALSREEMFEDIKRQLADCVLLNGVHKELLRYELEEKKRNIKRTRKITLGLEALKKALE
ncbi:hypothetical protein [Brazilian marseillevirus]|uniref:hypothetical protein n=1 Tax=Brazilian marseillevirus TaxID=1813599 RepID=UPI000783060E|nr:hypothetical protein A3303_gp138 [Brazilian marseillevirus]AMQ10646.1 hypothetical protein [Brazilian marseillevirus]